MEINKETSHFVGRLTKGEDLREELVRIAKEKKIQSGWFSIMGAFDYAELMEYDQIKRVYKESKTFERELEILNITGNISTLDGELFAHAHAILSYEDGDNIRVIGGHLGKSRIFAAEVHLTAFNEIQLKRVLDKETGLNLF